MTVHYDRALSMMVGKASEHETPSYAQGGL
jgi:hypothetical protein